jgi:S1-C subfamily serine protease
MNRALPLDVADHLRHRVLRWNRNQHVDMVSHQMPFFDLTLFLPGETVCFAIPIDTARFVIPRLIRDGRVRRSWLGVVGQTIPLSRRRAALEHLAAAGGVLVTGVERGSAGDTSKL